MKTYKSNLVSRLKQVYGHDKYASMKKQAWGWLGRQVNGVTDFLGDAASYVGNQFNNESELDKAFREHRLAAEKYKQKHDINKPGYNFSFGSNKQPVAKPQQPTNSAVNTSLNEQSDDEFMKEYEQENNITPATGSATQQTGQQPVAKPQQLAYQRGQEYDKAYARIDGIRKNMEKAKAQGASPEVLARFQKALDQENNKIYEQVGSDSFQKYRDDFHKGTMNSLNQRVDRNAQKLQQQSNENNNLDDQQFMKEFEANHNIQQQNKKTGNPPPVYTTPQGPKGRGAAAKARANKPKPNSVGNNSFAKWFQNLRRPGY